MNRGRRARVAGLLALLSILAGCGGEVEGVVLVSLDTTRADRIGCYGYEEAKTPILDMIAERGVRFAHAVAPVPVTTPSHASMFTGSYPPVHGVRYNGMFQLPESARTIAEVLSQAGWSTAAVVSAYPTSTVTGLSQGFQTYRDLFREKRSEELRRNAERKAAEVTDLALDWLRRRPKGPFFLWLHYFDPHWPYEPPFPHSAAFRGKPYDGEIAYVDAELKRVVDYLQEEGLWKRSLVLVVGDHGEGLYDHGEKMHSVLTYESTIRVPFLLHAPKVARGRVVEEPVTVADVAPTILDYAGRPVPDGLDGVSLRRVAEGGEAPKRTIYFESLAGSLVYGWSPIEGVRRGSWKYIAAASPELYDLASDPRETNNLLAREGERAQDMAAELHTLMARWTGTASGGDGAVMAVDPETLERLRSLGYVGGNLTEAKRGGANPRDRIHLESAILQASDLSSADAHAEAMTIWEAILEEDPTNLYVLENAAASAAKLNRLDRATELATRLVDSYPEYGLGFVLLGEIHVKAGRLERALATFEEGLGRHPENDALRYRAVVALLHLGRPGEALRGCDEALAREGASPAFLVARAAALAKQGNVSGATSALEAAVSRGYRDADLLRTEPILEEVRRLPRFEEIVSRVRGA